MLVPAGVPAPPVCRQSEFRKARSSSPRSTPTATARAMLSALPLPPLPPSPWTNANVPWSQPFGSFQPGFAPLLTLVLHKTATRDEPILWLDPTRRTALKFSRSELNPFLLACSPVRAFAIIARTTWTSLETQFRACWLLLVGSGTAAALSGFEAEMLVRNGRTQFALDIPPSLHHPPRAMAADQTEFDVFISYAHSDDIRGIVPALHEQLESDFQRLLQRHVEIFYDRSDIRDFDAWQVRCHRALRASRFFIVLLSPAYLGSDACRWEWEEWLKRELEHGQAGVGVACLWFIEIAQLDAPGDAGRLRQWKNELRQRFGVSFHAWREGGRDALRDAAARTELARLTDHVAQRLRLLALDRGQRGNLGWPQDRFVGRKPELRHLHERLLDAAPSAPVALIGIGGIGKTALALTFAFREADAFPGGRWLLRCEGHARLDSAMRPLVQDLGIELTGREKLDDTLAARRVLDTLRPRGLALFLLDNVDTPAFLAPGSLALLSGESGIRLLSTTRRAPGEFTAAGASVVPIDLDQLPEDHALDLIRLHQPGAAFASAVDENDAREIVRSLGGLTLAVETAAVYLGQNDPRVAEPRYAVRIADYLAGLRRDIASPGSGMSQLREVAATVRPTLARLDAPARTVLQLAALLPADSLPLPWLRGVAAKFHPSLANNAKIAERDEWTDLIRTLIGMRLLHPTSEPQVLTIHRLLQRVLDTELREERDEVVGLLESQLTARAWSIFNSQTAPADWELDALILAAPRCLDEHPIRDLANASVFLSDKIVTYRTLPATAGFLATVHKVLARLAASDPDNSAAKRDLSASLEKLGTLALAQGNLPEAQRLFRKFHRISRRLAGSDPDNVVFLSDCSVSFEKLGNVARAQDDLQKARHLFGESLSIRKRLTESDPDNTKFQDVLSVSLEKLGQVANAQDDLPEAQRLFGESLRIRKRLTESDPDNAAWKLALGISNSWLGNLATAQGNHDEAHRFHSARHTMIETLAKSDPANAAWQRDLSVSFEKLGDLATGPGNLPEARRLFAESLRIRERLAKTDSANAQWQRDLIASYQRSAIMAAKAGQPGEAAGHFSHCHLTLNRMREMRMHLDLALADFLAQLEQGALQNYADLIADSASLSAIAPPRPAPHIILAGIKTQPRREMSIEELRESARENFGKSYWEVAASDFQKLLAQGEPLADIAPKIVTCLLNAHEDLLPHDAASIEDLLRRLESAGHPTLAAGLRRQLEAKQPKPKKPWWKFW
jgi:tetratricopeptide (TPR) repeat protein